MKNIDVIYLVNRGILETSNHTLSPEYAYKVFKFKKWVRTVFEGIQESELALLSECGIPDVQEFNSKIVGLRCSDDLNGESTTELQDMEKKLNKFIKLRDALYEDSVPSPDLSTIPYNEWFLLQNENRAVKFNGDTIDVFSGHSEELLENILWTLPE